MGGNDLVVCVARRTDESFPLHQWESSSCRVGKNKLLVLNQSWWWTTARVVWFIDSFTCYLLVSPSVELELGRNLNPDAITEGNDVYFECRIRSNPPPTRVIWTHEVSRYLFTGIIIIDPSFVCLSSSYCIGAWSGAIRLALHDYTLPLLLLCPLLAQLDR